MAFNKPQLINTRAPINHNHDDIYAQKVHEHDNTYAKKTHNHDDLYSKISHSHSTQPSDLRFDSGCEIVDCNGRSVFTPYSSSGNVAIGFGNYNDRTGKSTNIYGDKIKVTANEDITFANRIIVPGGEDGGIRFANDDTITFDDTDNIYTFKHDTSTGDYYSKICCASLLLGADKKPAFTGSFKSVYNDPTYIYLGNVMICYGSTKMKCTTASKVVTSEISFPKTFKSVPFVNLTINAGSPQQVDVGATGVSTSNFTLNFVRTSTTETTIFWFAIGQA